LEKDRSSSANGLGAAASIRAVADGAKMAMLTRNNVSDIFIMEVLIPLFSIVCRKMRKFRD
ncbi:hypothetical protein Csa_019892, partial [Cucumis sativus]